MKSPLGAVGAEIAGRAVSEVMTPNPRKPKAAWMPRISTKEYSISNLPYLVQGFFWWVVDAGRPELICFECSASRAREDARGTEAG